MLVISCECSVAYANEKVSTSEQLFVRRISTLLREKCRACHGGDPTNIEGSLDVTSLKGLSLGGDSGEPAIVPGKPSESSLYLAVLRDSDEWSAMPPKEAERLSKTETEWLRDWISTGAIWPSKKRQAEIEEAYADEWSVEDGIPVATSGGLSDEWTKRKYDPESLWAYQPVQKPETRRHGSQAIDELIRSRLPDGLEIAGPADAEVLIRRATFDLTGLPPSPDEVTEFANRYAEDADRAMQDLIDRLLSSPHYGERMAQHWLDVVRYADSSGFANDYERGNAWRYRDYVVRSFNNDKPYDQFIREQLAGDEIDANDSESIVAAGFLRMGPWELTGMEVAKVARQRFLDDVTNSVGETFLAHSLQCARCHDHKFDPVPTRDYYGIQAVFATTQLAERKAEFLPTENQSGFSEKTVLERRHKKYKQTLAELDQAMLENAQEWYRQNDKDPSQWNKVVEKLSKQNSQSVFGRARGEMRKLKLAEKDYPPKLVGFTPEQFGLERVARKGIQRLQWEFDRYQPFALSVYSGRTPKLKNVSSPLRMPREPMKIGELERTTILTGGDPFAAGEAVQPSVLSVLDSQVPSKIPASITGRRKAFADWVANPANPLTTRTIVNRIWGWHFGQPIAGNPSNFGSTGKRPTHPELLDWLAATFVEEGWSFKRLHRTIMLSDAYRRSAEHPDRSQLAAYDPQRKSYAVFQPRRLTAEEIRDAMLAATGELNTALGGIPNRPEINLEAALQPRQVMGTFASAWVPNPKPEQRHRRSIYALKLRGLVDPAMDVFNKPSADFSCERRDVSTVTPQVFALFNSQASYSRALALADRVLKQQHGSDREAIDRCFQLAFGRAASPEEQKFCVEHWRQMIERHREISIEFEGQPLEVQRNAIEENTGEKFSFQETLYANSEFVPDLTPKDCDLRTRALADVCLVLFNSNEFCYVY
ncbi:PSD1 and planctomycete cytochrome C domain-containing protein [Thalassoroseus pseudoceratinae]|uniref:PSD1 and planctomycete cytochrome C domain-containing protein n=1 Tax=Thalassoroseus pseudoceratinae TaxID=2713176 RepID=UPI00197DD728